MDKKLKAAQDALDKIDAPDNDEADRMNEGDKAIRATRQLTDAQQEALAKQELARFRKFLDSRPPAPPAEPEL